MVDTDTDTGPEIETVTKNKGHPWKSCGCLVVLLFIGGTIGFAAGLPVGIFTGAGLWSVTSPEPNPAVVVETSPDTSNEDVAEAPPAVEENPPAEEPAPEPLEDDPWSSFRD